MIVFTDYKTCLNKTCFSLDHKLQVAKDALVAFFRVGRNFAGDHPFFDEGYSFVDAGMVGSAFGNFVDVVGMLFK